MLLYRIVHFSIDVMFVNGLIKIKVTILLPNLELYNDFHFWNIFIRE